MSTNRQPDSKPTVRENGIFRGALERQVRRRRVARSISDRCRMILHCADGLTNKAVAAELGVHEHTVGKWRRRFLKERIEGL